MSAVTEAVKQAVLKRVFPELLYDSDPEIERYFELRKSGRHGDALELYTRKLCRKYPREDRRYLILKYFRLNDPRYQVLLRQSVYELADGIILRLKANIDQLVRPMENVRTNDTMKLLGAVEVIIRCLPDDKYSAIQMAENYLKYAEILSYRAGEIRNVEALVREYLFEAQAAEEEGETNFMKRAEMLEERKRLDTASKTKYFDVSKVKFSEDDIARITLPPSVVRKEDMVLGYCYKYWHNLNDPGFERTVFLYSKKNGSNHHTIYRALKIARSKRYTDDEILNTLSTVVSNRYSYSVQGDYYMQAAWKRLKANLQAGGSGSSVTRNQNISAAIENPESAKVSGDSNPRGKKPRVMDVSSQEAKQAAGIIHHGTRTGLARKQLSGEAAREGIRNELEKRTALPERVRTESISEKIRKLSGTTYDIYRNIFLERVRGSIHGHLLSRRDRQRGLFDNSITKAEDLIFTYVRENYENPYLDWAASPECKSVETLGFTAVSLDGIIEDCFGKIRKAG